MKLPSCLRKFKKMLLYLASYSLLIIVMLAPVPQIYAAANPTFNRSLSGSIALEKGEIITEIIVNNPSIKLDVRPEEVSFPYLPISSISGSGDVFNIVDNFIYQESHSKDLLLKYTSIQANDYIQANYTVADLGYSDDYYSYNISSFTALKDFYEIESYTSRSVRRDIGYSDYKIVAQGFEVKWDNTNFTKARLWLQENVVFNDQVEIFLCPIGTDNYPNATNVLSTAGLYSGSGLASTTLIDGVQILPTYTFSEVTLSKGVYFVVVNYTTYVDGANSVMYWGNNTTPNTGLAYRSIDNFNLTSWSSNTWDFTLEVELLPVNSTFNGAFTFSDPKKVDLKDNSTNINSNYYTIQNSFVGFHYLKSNTSVSINFDTIYYFTTSYSASSVYSITNSTFNSMTCDWNITWSTNEISATYTLLSRNMSLIIPADWTDTFNWYYNLTSPFSYEKSAKTYITYLNLNTSAGDWWIETSSPNHLYSATFSDSVSETDRYVLGYWTTNGTHAFGYNGSIIILDAFVRGNNGSLYNDITGTLNYTLFDPNGQIIPLKTSLDANLSYVDVTSYSLNGLVNVTEGYFSTAINFDPSVYGSDLPGFWTAMVYWENGTEVGFYTQRIVVQTNTSFICEWEIEPGTNSWTTADLTRKQFDDINIRAFYYNISEPFFVSYGKAIPNAEVTYTPSWKSGGTFTDSHPSYTATVNADSAVGVHTIDILASGAFLINHTTSFDVIVFYKLAFDTLNTYYNANYTNKAYFYFALTDVSAGSNLTDISPGSPDDMTVTVDNGTDNYVLSSPVDYSFTYTGVSELWELDISTSTNNLAIGLYNVFVTVQYNDYRANYTDEYVSDVFVLEVSAPKTIIQINSADNSIYTYHTALFNFDFFDTNNSLDLTGAVVDVWFNVSDVSALVTPIGNSYQVEVTSNNPNTIGIKVYINVTKPNYVPINNYLLGELNVVIIQTEIVPVDVPPDMYDGYNTSVIIQFNDLDNIETIDGAYLESIITNSTSFVNISIVELGGGQYNITFINLDVDVFWLDMNITLAKPGYYNAVIRITIKIIVVQTDSQLLDSSSVIIYYNTGTSFNILYWDNVSFVNITNPGVSFSGNLTGVATPVYGFLNNITTVTIVSISTLGYYELIITIIEPGFAPQIIVVYILIQERETSVDSDYNDITFYADQTDQVLLNYTDELDLEEILTATLNIDFAADNSSLIVQDYFIINWVEVGSLYEITFDPIEINATGYVFLFNITLSKYGYETTFIIITVTINVHPTAIDPSSQDQDSVYTDEDGDFTIIYETAEDAFISGADLSYSLINGTSEDIENVILTQILDAYVVYVYINSSIVPVKSFLIELTFYKHGFENQTWIITIIISIHPATIDSSSENQNTIFADEDGEFTVIYETEEGDFISGAELDYNIINGTTAEILSVTYIQRSDNYVINVYFDESLIAGKNFSIELIFFKHGFENQTWVIYISVYEKITYEINIEIVGEVNQLGTIQFKATLDGFSIDLLVAMSPTNIHFYNSPSGDYVIITYVFTFANGTTMEYEIQAELVEISDGVFVAMTSNILIPWHVVKISYSVSYVPISQAVISSNSTSLKSVVTEKAAFMDILTFLFQEYTSYMAAGLAVIAVIFISLTVYFAVIRPRKQKRTAKKRGYLDKISKILTSVISMKKVIVVHNDAGLPVYEWDLGGEITVDSSLVTGFLQAVSGMGGEISGGEAQTVRKIDYGQFCVSSAGTDCITTYLFSTADISKDVEIGLADFVDWFEKRFHTILSTQWDGNTDEFQQNARQIIDTLSENLFIWTLHPLSVNVVKEKGVPKLDQLSQKIYKFIKDYKEVSISLALEYFNKSPVEETLSKIFELVDQTFLLRKRIR